MSTSQKTDGLWTMTKGEFEESVRKLEVAIVGRGGNPCQVFDRFRTDEEFTGRIADFALRGGLEASTDQKLARAILGQNFFGPEEWSTFYGANFTKKQLRELAEFPWSEDILNSPCPLVEGKAVKDTHFAFLGLNRLNGKQLTIVRLQELHPATGQPRFYWDEDPWYGEEDFATKTACSLRWYLMPLEIIPGSTDKTYEEQVAMLPQEYEVPLAIEEVLKDILYCRKNRVYLNPTKWGRCQDVGSVGGRVRVGRSDVLGLGVGHSRGGSRYSLVGVAASRKF